MIATGITNQAKVLSLRKQFTTTVKNNFYTSFEDLVHTLIKAYELFHILGPKS